MRERRLPHPPPPDSSSLPISSSPSIIQPSIISILKQTNLEPTQPSWLPLETLVLRTASVSLFPRSQEPEPGVALDSPTSRCQPGRSIPGRPRGTQHSRPLLGTSSPAFQRAAVALLPTPPSLLPSIFTPAPPALCRNVPQPATFRALLHPHSLGRVPSSPAVRPWRLTPVVSGPATPRTVGGCRALLQEIFLTPGSNPSLLCLLHRPEFCYHCATWRRTRFTQWRRPKSESRSVRGIALLCRGGHPPKAPPRRSTCPAR